MDPPPGKSHFTVAGGLGLLDLSCCALTATAATATAKRIALATAIAFRMMFLPPFGRRVRKTVPESWREMSQRGHRYRINGMPDKREPAAAIERFAAAGFDFAPNRLATNDQ